VKKVLVVLALGSHLRGGGGHAEPGVSAAAGAVVLDRSAGRSPDPANGGQPENARL